MDKKLNHWSAQELALLSKHSNRQISELTGRDLEEIGECRLRANIERNCWDAFDLERAE